ncbi:sulfite exporter TauE/SafE family protein [Rubripirellula sp.]|jgi:uncharacterized membrane protein YfcA|nr:sulfite exporter TauE/SafE family protein [Rubripirellula sp.]
MSSLLIGAVLIGLTLGMIGSGGSAITVPILVYVVGHEGKVSIAESMAIVGIISIFAAIPYGRSRQIDWRSVIYFGIPGMLGTYFGSWLGGLANQFVQLVFFGLILLVAAITMLRKSNSLHESNHNVHTINHGKDDHDDTSDIGNLNQESVRPLRVIKNAPSRSIESASITSNTPAVFIAIEGILVGILTGFVGVGGGFLIVPALVVLGKLPMRLAVGTSLVIIAAKSAVGFWKYQHDLGQMNLSVDPTTITIFAVIGILGSIAGRAINSRLNQRRLQTVFAIFLIAIGGFVIAKEGNKLVQNIQTAATENIQNASNSMNKKI